MATSKQEKGNQGEIGTSRADQAEQIERAILFTDFTVSDRAIAKQLGVSNRTVSQHRKRMENDGIILPKVTSTQSVPACWYEVCTLLVHPSPENDLLYDPVQQDDPSFQALVADIDSNGLHNSIGISQDGYIFDGHRRFAAVCFLGWEKVAVHIRAISYRDDRAEFIELLKSCNTQRVKTTAEVMREGIVGMDGEPWQNIHEYRREASEIDADGIETVKLRGEIHRSEIRDKISLKKAIIKVVDDNRKDWPLSDRKIFYRLLNIKGLLRNDVLKTPFINDPKHYDDVTDMCTRLRLDGSVPFESITDETRGVTLWKSHRNVGAFVNEELENLFSGYWRDLLQSQPNWVELLVEKNTVATSLRSIAAKYTLPMTSGRGYSSLPPRKDMLDRFKKSGREKLVIIVVSDFDPEGEDIPNSFGLSLRDDFGLSHDKLKIFKAALTHHQVKTLSLHEGQMAKEDSSRFPYFVSKYGNRCWELEAISDDTLRSIVESAIRKVLDVDTFERELEKQKKEQSELGLHRKKIKELIAGHLQD